MTTLRIIGIAVMLGATFGAGSAGAQTVNVDLTAQSTSGSNCGSGCTWSYDGIGSANNTVLTFDIGASRWVTGLAWSGVTGRASDQPTTRGSEMAIGLGDTSAVRYQFRPFVATTSTCPEPAGCGPETGSIDLLGVGSEFQVGIDGLLRIEFYETFDDGPGSIDAVYTAGALTITTSDVPVQLQRFDVE